MLQIKTLMTILGDKGIRGRKHLSEMSSRIVRIRGNKHNPNVILKLITVKNQV